jgi:hypothetical protein
VLEPFGVFGRHPARFVTGQVQVAFTLGWSTRRTIDLFGLRKVGGSALLWQVSSSITDLAAPTTTTRRWGLSTQGACWICDICDIYTALSSAVLAGR